MTHGTRSGYQLELKSNLIPCDLCRKANSEWSKQRRKAQPKIRVRKAKGEAKKTHGSLSSYRHCTSGDGGSKCTKCVEAKTQHAKIYREAKSIGMEVSDGAWPSPGWWQQMLGWDFMHQLNNEVQSWTRSSTVRAGDS